MCIRDSVWADSSGYVILFDSTATAYGPVIPAHGEFSRLGDISRAPFDYVLPAGFNGSTTSTSLLVSGTATIQIPAGVYDFCVANPKQKPVSYKHLSRVPPIFLGVAMRVPSLSHKNPSMLWYLGWPSST